MVKIPVPSLIKVPLVEVLIPEVERVTFPDPPTVSANPDPVIPPVRVSVPESELIREAEPRVIAPEMELVPLIFRKAPPDEIPVPFNVRASTPTEILPWISRAAPLVTEVPAAVVPRAVAC